MKRIISFLLCIVMLIGVLPVSVFAEQSVTKVHVTGITPPAAGNRAVELSTYDTLGIDPHTYGYRIVTQVCPWHDEKETAIDDIDYLFESGRTYYLEVVLEAMSGCRFANAEDITALANTNAGSTMKVEKTVKNDGRFLWVRFIYSVKGTRTYEDIKKVEFWNINKPKEGSKPRTDFTHIYDNSKVILSYWTLDGETVADSKPFIPDRDYHLLIVLKADANYHFASNVDVWHYNGPIAHTKVLRNNRTELVIQIPFYCTKLNEIGDVEIAGFPVPKAGARAYSLLHDELDVPRNQGYDLYTFVSYWKNTVGRALSVKDTFTEGGKYSVDVFLIADENCRFADASKITTRLIGVNPSLYNVKVSNGVDSDLLVLNFTFTATKNPPKTTISEISVDMVDKPVAGQKLGEYAVTPVGSGYSFPKDDGFAWMSWWIDDEQQNGGTCQYNKTYEVRIWVQTDCGTFDTASSNLTATINGKPAKIKKKGFHFAVISYTFPKTDEDPNPTYLVSFYTTGGGGTMDQVVVEKGSYTLPACGFKPPAGKHFKAWAIDSIDGEQLPAGDTIGVDKEYKLYAIYEDDESSHVHNFNQVKYNWACHWAACACGAVGGISQKHVYDNEQDSTCNGCAYQRQVEHVHAMAAILCNADYHWKVCTCGNTFEYEEHVFDNAADRQCNKCGYIKQGHYPHTMYAMLFDAEQHSYLCTCGEVYFTENHVFEGAGDLVCDVCGYQREAGCEHDYKQSYKCNASATDIGYTQYTCKKCGEVKFDNYTKPTGKLTLKCASRTSAAQKVSWKKLSTATGYQVQISTKDGKKWSTCATIKNGEVNNYTFKKLAAGNNYKFRVRFYIAADGKNYYSPWSKTFVSPTLPAGTTLTKLGSVKKGFSASWKKQVVTGYQIQYATNEKFTKAKTVTVKSAKTLKTTVSKLGAKKTYYVRIRTYKTIAKVNYFSAWSNKPYKVKTK